MNLVIYIKSFCNYNCLFRFNNIKRIFLDFILEDIFRRENSLKKLFLYLCTVCAILSINSFYLIFFIVKKQNTLIISLFLLIVSMLFLTLINDPEELAGYMLVSVFLNFLFLVYFFLNIKIRLLNKKFIN